MAGCGAKQIEIWDSGVPVELYGLPQCSRSFWGHSKHSLKMSSNSKMSVHRAKQIEISDSGMLVEDIWGTFDLVVFKIIVRPFGALSENSP